MCKSGDQGNQSGQVKKQYEEATNLDIKPEEQDEEEVNKHKQAYCQKELLYKRFPICAWLPEYSRDILLKDFIAGVTVGLTAIPQSIAYAVVAGLQPQYGLYSAFVGCFVYCIFGSCKDITIGPTAILALMTQTYVSSHGPDYAVLLAFLCGIVILLSGFLRLSFLVEFISMPVTVGFTTAAALTIASSQLKGLFGLKGSSHDFVDSWVNFFSNFNTFRVGDTILGLSTIVLLMFLKTVKDNAAKWSGEQDFLKKTYDVLGLARNAIVVIGGTFLAYIFSLYDKQPFLLTDSRTDPKGPVSSGLPPFQPPPFSTTQGNTTTTFFEMTKELGGAVIVIPLIAILESIAIAKAFANGRTIDATQEMIALGICNIVGSFFFSFPTTGSFTRTAVNSASGVVTPAGGIFTGILVLLSLSFLTSTFYYIPKATLAGLIMCAMFYMIEYRSVRIVWKTKKLDLVPMMTTLFSCLLLGLEYGMLVGIGVNILFLLYLSARPRVSLHWKLVNESPILIVTPTQNLTFPASDYIREIVLESCAHKNRAQAKVVIDGSHVHYIDSTMAKGIKMLLDDLKIRGQDVIFWHWNKSSMKTMLGFAPQLHDRFIFEDSLSDIFNTSTKQNSNGAVKYEKVSMNDDSAL